MIINTVRRDAQDNPCWFRCNAVYSYNAKGERYLVAEAIEGPTSAIVAAKVYELEAQGKIKVQYIAVR